MKPSTIYRYYLRIWTLGESISMQHQELTTALKIQCKHIILKAPQLDAAKLDKQVKGIETVTKSTAVKGMPGYKEENGTILMMLSFLIVISAFIISVFFYVITIQKTSSIWCNEGNWSFKSIYF